jgi:hypothetical protein
VRPYFIRRHRDRLPALPSSRTPCRQGRHHRTATDTCSPEPPSTAQPHAAPAPSAPGTPPGNHDRLGLASPEDHLMIGNLGLERHRPRTHANERTPHRNTGRVSRPRRDRGATEAQPRRDRGKMITDVCSPALPGLRPAVRLAGPARPVTSIQERGTAGAAGRGRRAAPDRSAARSTGPTGRPDPAAPREAAGTPASHARHRPAMASSPGHKEAALATQTRTRAVQRRDRRANRAARHRESRPGIPAHRGRVNCSSSATEAGDLRELGA